jgi:hypothetical protein
MKTLKFQFCTPKTVEHHRQQIADFVAFESEGSLKVDNETLTHHQVLMDKDSRLFVLVVPWPGERNWCINLADFEIMKSMNAKICLCKIDGGGLKFEGSIQCSQIVPAKLRPVSSRGMTACLLMRSDFEQLLSPEIPRLK